jgi:hypothetical protein
MTMVNRFFLPVLWLLSLAVCPGCSGPAGTDAESRVLHRWLEDPDNSPLIDFSYAGYRNGEEVPDWRSANLPFFDVTRYGAVPDDGKDDIDAIQAAIDAAATGGGVVRFPRGTFDFDVGTARRYLHVHSSDIILLGAGDGIDGTILHDHTPSETPDPSKPWLAGNYPSFIHIGKLPRDSAFDLFGNPELLLSRLKPAARNSLVLEAADPSRLKAGAIYLVTQRDPDGSLLRELTFPMKSVSDHWQDTTGEASYKYRQMVHIDSVAGNRVFLGAPLHRELRQEWDPCIRELPHMIQDVGVAGFLMRTDWEGPLEHHKNGEHDNGWDHIKINDAANCWIYSNIFENTSSAVSITGGYHCTVFDCQIRGVPGHNGFIIGGWSTGNLFYNLKGDRQMHTWSIQGYAGGNVFFQVFSQEPSAIDCHAGLTVSNLFDNICGGSWKHGGNPGYLPPAHGNGLVIWNWSTGITEPYKGRIKSTMGELGQTPGLVAVGIRGSYGQTVYIRDEDGILLSADRETAAATIEFLNESPVPASLFLEQRRRRLGDPFRGLNIR